MQTLSGVYVFYMYANATTDRFGRKFVYDDGRAFSIFRQQRRRPELRAVKFRACLRFATWYEF